jgi:hypothetical protein
MSARVYESLVRDVRNLLEAIDSFRYAQLTKDEACRILPLWRRWTRAVVPILIVPRDFAALACS